MNDLDYLDRDLSEVQEFRRSPSAPPLPPPWLVITSSWPGYLLQNQPCVMPVLFSWSRAGFLHGRGCCDKVAGPGRIREDGRRHHPPALLSGELSFIAVLPYA